jgi:hypothetical protein
MMQNWKLLKNDKKTDLRTIKQQLLNPKNIYLNLLEKYQTKTKINH